MGEWINRPAIQQDWMSLLYLINFFLVTALYFFNPNRLKSLLSINKLSFYFSKFGDDTNFNYVTPFNILSFLLIVNGLTLLCSLIFKNFYTPFQYAFEFYYFLFIFATLFSVRFFLVHFIIKQLGFLKKIQRYYFRSFTYNTLFGLFSIVLSLLFYYSPISHLVIFFAFGILIVILISAQTVLLFSFLKRYSQEVFYIIVYLCMVKIMPWLWFYFLFLETRL